MLETVNDYAQIAAAATTVFGLILILYQVVQLRKTLETSAANAIYDEAARFRTQLMHWPDVRPFVAEGRALAGTEDAVLVSRVRTASEMLLNYLEKIEVHRESLNGRESRIWRQYVRDSLAEAPAAQDIVNDRPAHYAGALPEIAQEVSPES